MNCTLYQHRILKIATALLCLILCFCLSSKDAFAAAGTIYESEPNNTYGTADLTYDDYDNYGYISTTSDVDWWKIKFNSSGSANFWLGNIPSGCDYDLRLYSSNGTTLLQSSTNSGNANELITINVSANVYYYIKITSYSGSSSSSRYLFRSKLYPNVIGTKTDLQSDSLVFNVYLKGLLALVSTDVNYNLFVEHGYSGTQNRHINSVSQFAQASPLSNPELGTMSVVAAFSGINYVHNGNTTNHSASFGGSVYVPAGYAWDNKLDSSGYLFPLNNTVTVKSIAYFTCSTAGTPRTRENSIVIP